MKLGVGKWVQILDTGLLPGKMIQQLNGQTQRLLGQQSLAAYTGLQVDIDRIRQDNEAKGDSVNRKAGLIIYDGRMFFNYSSVHAFLYVFCMILVSSM